MKFVVCRGHFMVGFLSGTLGTLCVCLRGTLTVFPLQRIRGNHSFVPFLHYTSQTRCGIWGIRGCLLYCPWCGLVFRFDHVYVFLWAFLGDFSCRFSGGGSTASLFVCGSYSKPLYYLHVRLQVTLRGHELMGLNSWPSTFFSITARLF